MIPTFIGYICAGLALLAIIFFTISQYEKAKYRASVATQLVAENKYNELLTYDPNAETDNNSEYHNATIYWKSIMDDFEKITANNSGAYTGTAVPAYIFSMSTLVAFGLILKHAEKAKEEEDKNV